LPPAEAPVMENYAVSYPKDIVIPGAYDIKAYLAMLEGKRVGLVVNHTSLIEETHLVDKLISLGINVVTIFAPEHGFRGQADAGADIANEIDAKTGIKITSLYGDKKKPTAADLKDIDVLVFDIQDVGVRFYTYLGTLLYVMESAGEYGKPVIVLDRPNPNGHYIDGPVLDTARYRSFVGPLPIPVVYGMTLGEMARMINGEGWIKKQCSLTVIPCKNYDHNTPYTLPVKPSPNLPNQRSVLLYPGICFFEGTEMSLGRGTEVPFQVVGHPDYPDHTFSFTPVSRPGAKNPPLKDVTCYGFDLTQVDLDSLYHLRKMDLSVLLTAYQRMDKSTFFNASWFDKLAGTDTFRKAIEAGRSEEQIRESWEVPLKKFNARRLKYLLYRDF
jgi:uncharacterized protein YbbC (DUF1343 family)